MEGKRIRQARLAAGLTLKDLSSRLAISGVSLTRAALSKYECDKSTPNARVILALAEHLGVDPTFLLDPPSVEITWLAFRKKARLSKSKQDQLKARASSVVERHVHLHELLTPDQAPTFMKPRRVSDVCEVEKLACDLRSLWKLGDGPVESVTHTIEDHGGVVVALETGGDDFDGLSGWASNRYPVIISHIDKPADRKRYNLSHELGHLAIVADPSSDKESESHAHRFASAFLAPEATAKRELGSSRNSLRLEELFILKQKYGLSIQAWARRASDLSIITHSKYVYLCKQISSRGWKSVEPVILENDESPTRLNQLVFRAVAEGVLDESEARAEYPQSFTVTDAVLPGAELGRKTAMDLLKSTEAERDQVLSTAAEALAGMYETGSELRSFEATEVLDQDEQASSKNPS